MKMMIEKILMEYYKNIPGIPNDNRVNELLDEISNNVKKCERLPRMNYFEFTVSQVQFVRRSICAMQILLLSMCLWGLLCFDNDLWKLAWISSLLPILIMGEMLEFSKTFSNNMFEMELTAKYRVQQILLARVLILGLVNFTEMSILFICSGFEMATFSFTILVYMCVPYLLTIFLCLLTVNRVSGKECNFVIVAIGICVSGGTGCLAFYYPQIYQESMEIYWYLLALMFDMGAFAEIVRIMKDCSKKLDGVKEYNAYD